MKFLLELIQFFVDEVKEMEEIDAVYFAVNNPIAGGNKDEYETQEA